MPKQLMIDPPEGWRYGFPKPVPSEVLKSQSLMRIWLAGEGYPAKDIELALKYSRYYETEIQDGH